MLVFPQLVTGASALYPLKKTSIQRSAVNTLGDGTTVVFADPDGAALGWELHASGLTAAEASAIETLFQATSGMWQTFTFLDPAGNLLMQSEDLGATAWTNGGLIELTPGIDDPLGTTRATRVINAGGGPQEVAQTLAVPGNFQYCLSVWARTIGGSAVTLLAIYHRRRRDQNVCSDGRVGTNSDLRNLRAIHVILDLRGAIGRRGVGRFVRHAGGSAIGSFRLQANRGAWRRLWEGAVRGGSTYDYGSRYRRL